MAPGSSRPDAQQPLPRPMVREPVTRSTLPSAGAKLVYRPPYLTACMASASLVAVSTFAESGSLLLVHTRLWCLRCCPQSLPSQHV